MWCRVSESSVPDISRQCIGLILKIDFPRRMDIPPSNIRLLLLMNHPVTRRHILEERKHSYIVVSESISPSFPQICLYTQKHSFSNLDVMIIIPLSSKFSNKRNWAEVSSVFDWIQFSLRGIYTDFMSGLWWSSYQKYATFRTSRFSSSACLCSFSDT